MLFELVVPRVFTHHGRNVLSKFRGLKVPCVSRTNRSLKLPLLHPDASAVKRFSDSSDAEKFVSDGSLISPSSGQNNGKKFYAVKIGREPGIYTDWSTAEKQVAKWSGAVFRSFKSYDTAKAFLLDAIATPQEEKPSVQSMPGYIQCHKIRQHQVKDAAALMNTDNMNNKAESSEMNYDHSVQTHPNQEQHQYAAATRSSSGTCSADGSDASASLVPSKEIEQEFATHPQSTTPVSVKLHDDSIITVWTDGSALGNGKNNARAGIGVYFGPGDERNISEPLLGPRQTNQRAELTAIYKALKILPLDQHVSIVTDSQYAINCVIEWYPKWRSKWADGEWKTATGKVVENQDVVKQIAELVERRTPAKTDFRWIQGHSGDIGNEQADGLARRGAAIAINSTLAHSRSSKSKEKGLSDKTGDE